jgi:hypothetical protein
VTEFSWAEDLQDPRPQVLVRRDRDRPCRGGLARDGVKDREVDGPVAVGVPFERGAPDAAAPEHDDLAGARGCRAGSGR